MAIDREWLSPREAALALTRAVLAGAGMALRQSTVLAVEEVEVGLVGLAPKLDGATIVQLSDFHVGGWGWKPALVQEAIERASAFRPDLTVLTGDFISSRRGAAWCGPALRGLEARSGVFAVMGNHDYGHGDQIARALQFGLGEAGIRVLHNEAVVLPVRGGRLWLAGLDDGYSRRADLRRALAALPDAGNEPRILLSHYPDVVQKLPTGAVDLVLSGHTHGCQVRLPVVAALARRHAGTSFTAGLYRANGTLLYVNRGIGTVALPARVRSRPELTVLRLRARRGERGASCTTTPESTSRPGMAETAR